jgi:hypothetical protein
MKSILIASAFFALVPAANALDLPRLIKPASPPLNQAAFHRYATCLETCKRRPTSGAAAPISNNAAA